MHLANATFKYLSVIFTRSDNGEKSRSKLAQ